MLRNPTGQVLFQFHTSCSSWKFCLNLPYVNQCKGFKLILKTFRSFTFDFNSFLSWRIWYINFFYALINIFPQPHSVMKCHLICSFHCYVDLVILISLLLFVSGWNPFLHVLLNQSEVKMNESKTHSDWIIHSNLRRHVHHILWQ